MLPLKINTLKVIKGKGRGKSLGIPTINFAIPDNLNLEYGVYAGKVLIDNVFLPSAIHFGPRPVFNEKEPSFEVYILTRFMVIPNETELEIIKFIREIRSFSSPLEMVKQINEDIKEIKRALKK